MDKKMVSSTFDIMRQLEGLQKIIETHQYRHECTSIDEFGGSDVIISKIMKKSHQDFNRNHPLVISLQSTPPQRRLVITKDAKELSWLFYQLRDAFGSRIDYISKYDFYGILAQSALDLIVKKNDTQTSNDLLLIVLSTSRDIMRCMELNS